jgi:hypothetical protein
VGDANTKLYHLRASTRCRKFFIPSIQAQDRVLTNHGDKEQAVHQFFSRQFGSPQLRQSTINWEVLALQRYDLADLDREISDEEIESTIRQTLPEKAPGLDGYIGGGGVKSCWTIVKEEVTAAI